MVPDKFPLTSEQFELLLAFEASSSIGTLAKRLGKDPSVISRGLQRLSETLPVIAKQSGRWKITSFGRDINSITRKFLTEIQGKLPKTGAGPKREMAPCLSKNALLLIINAQNALLDPGFGPRNNENAEKNILCLLKHWRKKGKPVIHVKHVMDEPGTPFYIGSRLVEIIPMLSPCKDEVILEKRKASAFSGTGLLEILDKRGIDTVVMTGFTANECIDASAKQSFDLGFTTYVVGDATAMFDVPGPGGSFHKADRVHRLVLANLHAFFATILETAPLMKLLESNSN